VSMRIFLRAFDAGQRIGPIRIRMAAESGVHLDCRLGDRDAAFRRRSIRVGRCSNVSAQRSILLPVVRCERRPCGRAERGLRAEDSPCHGAGHGAGAPHFCGGAEVPCQGDKVDAGVGADHRGGAVGRGGCPPR
jgi:hypothetical protein